jgi:predicted transcriptional regulator
MRKIRILTVLFIFITIPLYSLIETGKKAPSFHVTYGRGHSLKSSDLRGKVIIGFYESRGSSEKNNSLKDELNSFKSSSAGGRDNRIIRLAVIDAAEANMASAWIWRRNFIKKSEELGINIYGDWNGRMKRDFSFPDNESVFIIIDHKNVIRYIHPGKVPGIEFEKIKNLIRRILSEK